MESGVFFLMTRFSYTALDPRGAELTGRLDATDVKQVVAILKGQGLFPTEVAELAEAKTKPRKETSRKDSASVHQPRSALHLHFIRRVGSRELAVFTRQLATLLKAGMPLVRGLEVLARQARNEALRLLLEALAGTIKSGGTL